MFLERTVARIEADLIAQGWSYQPEWYVADDGGKRLLALASRLGVPVPDGEQGSSPMLTITTCDEHAPGWQPFNQPGPIGWHNDYSTWPRRPELSLSWVVSTPRPGLPAGDWRVASCAHVMAELEQSVRGRDALDVLANRDLPFCFAEDEPVRRFRVLDRDGTHVRVRYYGRALRLGLELTARKDRSDVLDALTTWEQTADRVGHTCAVHPGALLVCHNWHAMHDRLAQGPGRQSILCAAFAA